MHQFIWRAFRFNAMVCVGVYLIQSIRAEYAWVLWCALLTLFWLGLAGVLSTVDYLVHEEE